MAEEDKDLKTEEATSKRVRETEEKGRREESGRAEREWRW